MSELPAECLTVEALLPELALGVLPGDERALAIAHVETCRRCSSVAAELSASADEMLHLAPPAEPPVGFELRLLQRMRAPRSRRRPRRLLGAMAAAAAVVVFVGGLFAGHVISPGTAYKPDTDLEAAPLLAGSHNVGRVMVYAGNPTWVFMYMQDRSWTGPMRCQVVQQQGPAITLGKFWLSAGKGAWAASVDEPAGRLTEARVVNAQGRVLAVAHLG